MQAMADSLTLAESLVETGKGFGVKTQAVVSDMNQPLGKFVGNALEVYECLKILRGEADELMHPTVELSIELTSRMLLAVGIVDSIEAAKGTIDEILGSGLALEKFRENVEAQSGDPRICDDPELLVATDLLSVEIVSEKSGFITGIDTRAMGNSISQIGGGRTRVEDKIDHAVGYSCEVKMGSEVRSGDILGILYCRNEDRAEKIRTKLQAAHSIAEENPVKQDLVRAIVS